MSNTTTHEESIFDDPNTDVEPASDEQQDENFYEAEGDTPKSFDKFAMKTNLKINELSQSLKDSNKLNSYFARGLKANEIAEKDPEFAKRLSRQEEYSDLFESVQPQTNNEDSDRLIKEAISDLVVDGNRLGLKDRHLIKENKTFQRYFKAHVLAGDDPEVAAYEAFAKAYPSKSNMVETSFLSASSEVTTQRKETPEAAIAKKFNDPRTFPKFLQKRIKK